MALDREHMKMRYAIDKNRVAALGHAGSKLQGYGGAAMKCFNKKTKDGDEMTCIGPVLLSCLQPYLKNAMLAAQKLDTVASTYIGGSPIVPILPKTSELQSPGQIGDFLVGVQKSIERIRVRDNISAEHERMKQTLSEVTPIFTLLGVKLDNLYHRTII